jgi:hypothetical protein
MIVLYFLVLIASFMFIFHAKVKKVKYTKVVLIMLAIAYIILTPLYPQAVWYATYVAWIVNGVIFAIIFGIYCIAILYDYLTLPITTYTKPASQSTPKSNTQPPKPQVDPTTSFKVMKLTKTYKDLNADYLQSTWTVEDYSIMETSELVSKVEKAYKILVLKEDPTELVKFMMVPGALIGIMSNGDALVLVQNNSLPLLYNDEKYVDVQMLNPKEIALISDTGHKLVVNV